MTAAPSLRTVRANREAHRRSLHHLHPALKRSEPFHVQVPSMQSMRLLFQDLDRMSQTLNQPLSSQSEVGMLFAEAVSSIFWYQARMLLQSIVL